MLFDKQTAPKELINSPHYHSHSSDAIFFPQFSSPASQPVSVCAPSLTQPLPTSHASHFTLLCRRLHISTPHPHHRQHLHLSLAPPSPLRKSSPSSAFFFFPLRFGRLSPACLSSAVTSVSLFFPPFFQNPPPEKREQGVKVSKRILSSHNRRHYFHIRRCIIHKTNNEGRWWWWWWEDVSLRKTPYLGEWISLQSCSVHVCATYAVSNENTPPTAPNVQRSWQKVPVRPSCLRSCPPSLIINTCIYNKTCQTLIKPRAAQDLETFTTTRF